MAAANKPTKITIVMPFPNQVPMEPQYAETTWKLLESAIHEIYKKNASGLSFEELYRNAYNMVLHKYGDMLYGGLRRVVDQQLRTVADAVASVPDDVFLFRLNDAWHDHLQSMLMIRDILMYMDRAYVAPKQLLPVYDLGLVLFCEVVAHHPNIKERLLRTLLDMVFRERCGEIINRSLVKNITQMLVDLGVNSREVYEEDFEAPFLAATSDFYRLESREFLASNSCPDYLRKVEMRLKEELDRVHHYLDQQSSEAKVRDVVEQQLISAHMQNLVHMQNSGLLVMLRDDKVADLSRMYKLFSKVEGGLTCMKELMSEHIRACGKEIVTDEQNIKERGAFVQQLLDLKYKYDYLQKHAFNMDKTFQHTINKAFEYFINLNSKSPELISLFIDAKLRKGLKGKTEEEIDALLDQVMMLFRFIQEKDVFEKYFKQHLARRLLLGTSMSDEAERNMISKLKSECGYQFTTKLEGMFNDMRISGDMMERFKERIGCAGSKAVLHGVEMNVQVLTTGFWPTQVAASCTLPPEIVHCCDTFKKFYLGEHSGRKLTWQTNMGTVDLKANYSNRTRELTVSTYQMSILMMFNSADVITFKELQERTGIPTSDLTRNLLSLSCGKYRVLLKDSKGKDIAPQDRFAYNAKFKSKLVKVRITPVAATEAQGATLRRKIDEDRNHQIEACIVRIMKSRKTMNHASLVAEATKQLSTRFMPNPTAIKKRIESLIEREYLERLKTDRKTYQYLA